MRVFRQCFILPVALMLVAGCGEGGPDRGQVSGVVTWDGKPIADATVSFMPSQGRASVGTTDQNGVYKLAYAKGQTGALLGDHKILISHDPNDLTIKPDRELPAELSQRKKTPLKRTVEPGNNAFDFEISEAK